MPAGMTHEEHLAQMQKEAEMQKRGAVAMGFDQDKTTHHFGLTPRGGFIQVQANDPVDTTNIDGIRSHLEAIASAFAAGDFSKPSMTHDETPPGVRVMQRLKSAIAFRFEQTDRGGIVRITTNDAAARKAVHAFLRYQIKEHATGDSPKPAQSIRPRGVQAR
jgi:hypothetical protein